MHLKGINDDREPPDPFSTPALFFCFLKQSRCTSNGCFGSHTPRPAGKLIWRVRLWHEGREKRFGPFTNKTEARDFYEKAKQEQKQGKFFPERYQQGGYDLVETIIDDYMIENTNKSRKEDQRHADWWKSRLTGKRLNHLTPVILDQAKADLFRTPYAPQTVLHYLKFLRHVLNLAVRDGKLERSPFVRVELPTVTANRTRCLTLDEEAKVLKALGPTYGPWARLAILTGMRKSEQFGLRWKDVDLERGIITLPQTKAGGVQYVHLNDEARAILRSLDSWQGSVWVFPSDNPARPIDGRNFYGRIWMPAVEEAEIEWATWHDLRHCFASRLAMNGATEGTIAALLRHSSTALVRTVRPPEPVTPTGRCSGNYGLWERNNRAGQRCVK